MAGRIALEDFGQRLVEVPTAVCDANPLEPQPREPEPLDMPADPAPDPQAALQASLARIAVALETLASEQADLHARCVHQTAEALGAAAETLLPALARAGFAALVADTAKTVAECGQWPEIAVSLDADAAENVARYLSGSGSAGRIRIDALPGAAPGEAAISWDGGGAEIDAEAMAATVLAEYRRKLDSLAQTGA